MEALRTDPATQRERYIALSRNLPFDEHIYLAWEGGESNADQRRGCDKLMKMVADIVANGGLVSWDAGTDTDTCQVKVEFTVGGDYPWVAACLGLVGHTSTYPCVWCEVHKDNLGVWRPNRLDSEGFATPRTRTRQLVLAHLFDDAGGTCPCCNKTFANRADAQAKWAALAPTPRKTYSSLHLGTYCLQGCGPRTAHARESHAR
jgi:hypothetical protein